MNTLSKSIVSHVGSFLTPEDIGRAARAFRDERHITSGLLTSLMSLPMFCREYGQWRKGITWKEGSSPPLTQKDVSFMCSNFRQIEEAINLEFSQDPCRYKAEIYKMVKGERIVIKTYINE